MKKLIVIVLTRCTFVFSQGFRSVAADQGYTPLEEVAGTYAFTGHGSLAVCLANTPPSFPPATCGSPGSIVVPLTLEDVGVETIDAAGNTCATVTETEAGFPISAAPTTVLIAHIAGPLTSYDPRTGTGEGSFTGYVGGQCRGAIFDSTGATVVSTGTSHFAASDRGKRIDFMVTSITNAAGSLGGFSISGTEVRE
ncbi:MAG TPA: hypothetical protein VKJ47_24570 [Candidatus Binatia bacterium]|nr:hypothetical protein [Candidatus Binatia bacterium]